MGYVCKLFLGQTFVLGAKSERNFWVFFCLLPSVLKVINFQWQLIISEEKLDAVWLFVWWKLSKVFFNWKPSLLHCISIHFALYLLSQFRIITMTFYVMTDSLAEEKMIFLKDIRAMR